MLPVAEAPKHDATRRSDLRWGVVERIAASQHLKSSPRLCQFLLYVAECAIREAPEEATEQQIGIRVFGRPPGYNSSEDSIVRTHARLLRQKLEAYFAEEGVGEKFIVEMPKGHYLPVFVDRPASSPAATKPRAEQAAETAHVAVPEAAALRLDSSKAKRLLSWCPPLELDAALSATVRWFRDLREGADARAVTVGQIETLA